MNAKLAGIPETLLIPLWARAVEGRRPNPIVNDDKAAEMVSRIDYDFSKFDKSWLSQVGVSIRTMLLDNAVRAFLERNHAAVVINLGAGLDTRHERLGFKNICWYELDVPESIDLRRRFFMESERYRFLAKSMFDVSWVDEVDVVGKPVLLIAEGLFMYFTEEELKPLFKMLATRFSGGEMLFEMLAPFLVGKSKHHDSVGKIGSKAEFKWGLKNSREVTTWHSGIEFVDEWNYFDYRKDRWKWFGRIARLPFIRPRLSNRIVHLRFA